MSLVEAAEAVRQKGRFGDTVLMHVNPEEAKALAHGSGGYLTTNPDTGLPEAFLPALLPILGGLGGTALATSGALTGLGAAGAFLTANPFLAGAIGSGLGKFIGTGDLGEGLKTGLISGVTGGLLQGLSGGEFIRSPEAIGGAEALAAAPTVTANQADALQSALETQAAANAGMAPTSSATLANTYIDPSKVTAELGGRKIMDQATLDAAQGALAKVPSDFNVAQNIIEPGKSILTPSTPAYVDPALGVLREGNLNIAGELAGGVGSAIIGDTLNPQTVDFDDIAKRSYDAPESFAKRERFLPDEDYRGGIDPEFDYFGDITYAADGGPIKMQDGGVTSFSSSKDVADAFSQGLPAAAYAEQMRRGVMGDKSFTAAYMDAMSKLFNMFRSEEGQRGGRIAEKVGPKLVDRNRADRVLQELLGSDEFVIPVDRTVDMPKTPTRRYDGGAIKMQDGMGLAAMAGVMDDADPDSAMMQIQSMMMEGQQGDEDTSNIIIDEAISAIRGEHANPEVAIQAFVEQYGENALDVLVTQVQQEEMLEQMGRNQDMLVEGDGMIEGMGKGRDDMVQATLEGEQDVLLSDGEFVLPADVVSGIGDGSSKAGEAELMALIDRVRTRRTGTKEPPNMVGEVLPA